MALHDITLNSNVIDLAFNEDCSMIALLHQKGVSVFEWKSVSASGSAPTLTGQFTFKESDLAAYFYQQISFSKAKDFLVVKSNGVTKFIDNLVFNDNTDRMEVNGHSKVASSSLLTLPVFLYENNLLNPLGEGKSVLDNSGVIPDVGYDKLPTAPSWVDIIANVNSKLAFGMSGNGHLYANSRLLVKNCTSLVVTDAHLIFTTTTHLIKFVHITNINNEIGGYQIFRPSRGTY